MTFDRNTRPLQKLLLGYLGIAILGGFLLLLPFTHAAEASATDYWFTAISALSTTGLTTINTAEHYNFAGELITLILFQIGGVGYMSLVGFVVYSVGHRHRQADDSDDMLMKDLQPPEGMSLRQFVLLVLKFTLIAELIGAVLLSYAFWQQGESEYIWKGIFISVSAFCTAGLDLFENSLTEYSDNYLVNWVVIILTMAGALGFLFLTNLVEVVKGKTQLCLSSKIIIAVVAASLALGIFGTAVAGSPVIEIETTPYWMAVIFQSVSIITTSGFATVSMEGFVPVNIVLIILLMFVGASPSGTGGGAKSTTVAAVLAGLKAFVRGHSQVTVFGKAIPYHRVEYAMSALALRILLVIVGALGLQYLQPLDSVDVWFEVTSAIATVGLSKGITGDLSTASKWLIIAVMFAGRVGPLSIMIALLRSRKDDTADTEQEDVAVES